MVSFIARDSNCLIRFFSTVDLQLGYKAYTGMNKVLFSPPNIVTGRPAVVSYSKRFNNTYIFAYGYQTGLFSWSLLVQTIDDNQNLNNITEYAIPSSQKPIDIDMTYIGKNRSTILF